MILAIYYIIILAPYISNLIAILPYHRYLIFNSGIYLNNT